MVPNHTAAEVRMPVHAAPINLADRIVSCLAELGVEYVFGVPGAAIDPLYHALARSEERGGPRAVVARHESGAVFMADGYARETGRLGVACATTGPGITNLITGVACAYANEIPLLVITGQPPLAMHGRGAFQDSSCAGIDAIAMLRPCTRYDTLVTHPDQLESKLKAAIMRAQQSPKGPVHISIPVDMQREPPSKAAPHLPPLLSTRTVDALPALDRVLDEIAAAGNVVWIIGNGCGREAGTVVALAEATGAPFITAPNAKGLIDPRHPLFAGVFGFGGHTQATHLLERCPDLLLAFGTRLTEWNTGGGSKALLNERLILIDDCEEHFLHAPMARLQMKGDIGAIARAMRQRLEPAIKLREEAPLLPLSGHADATRRSREAHAPVEHEEVLFALSQHCPPGTRVVADAGTATAWAVHSLAIRNRRAPLRLASAPAPQRERRTRQRSWLQVTTDFSPMGWAIGAGVGMARARQDGPVICLTGDGSYLMSGQELSVARVENLPLILIVFNDGAYGMVRHLQRRAGLPETAVALPPVDFAMQARALGIEAFRVRDRVSFEAIPWAELLTLPRPTLLDIQVDPEVPPPFNMGAAIKLG
ncbi:MAG: thiamine pyrophosphate-binding protein [Betaproteobacteria bacterium]|nr:thiamine pyrophosphate-binding protein [Betaproteobacteria bacterium]